MPKKNTWTQKEDKLLVRSIKKFGKHQWASIAVQMHQKYSLKKRTGKQYRQRWINHLDPSVKKGKWDSNEQAQMFKLHQAHGNKWKCIAEGLPGRSENTVKNHFYSMLRRSLRRISKYLGSKNSSWKVKSIKPAALSAVFDIITGMRYKNRLDNQKDTKNQILFEFKQKQQQEFENYIKENCQNLSIDIFKFTPSNSRNKIISNSGINKQVKKQQGDQNVSQQNGCQALFGDGNEQMTDQRRDERLAQIIEKMQIINNLYQKIKQKREPYQRKKRSYQKNQESLQNLYEQNSEQDQVSVQKQLSLEKPTIKIQTRLSRNFKRNRQLLENQSQQKIQVINMSRLSRKIKSSLKRTSKNVKRSLEQTKNWSLEKKQLNKQDKKNNQLIQSDQGSTFLIVRNARKQGQQKNHVKQEIEQQKIQTDSVKQQIQGQMWYNQAFRDLKQIAIDQMMDEQQEQRKRRFSNNLLNQTPKLRTTPLAMTPRQGMWGRRSFGQFNPDQIEIQKNQLNDFLNQVKNEMNQKNDQLKPRRRNSLSNDTGNQILRDFNI